MHCYERPTVALVLEVPRERSPGNWEWVACEVTPEVREIAFTEQELCRLLRSYGSLIAEMASASDPADYPHIRLRVYGLFTGRTLGKLRFKRDADTGRYVPAGDPIVVLPPMYTWPDEVVRGWSVLHGRLPSCRTCPLK